MSGEPFPVPGDFCSIPRDIYGKATCIGCGESFHVTIYGIRPRKVCQLCGIIHTLTCCDCN